MTGSRTLISKPKELHLLDLQRESLCVCVCVSSGGHLTQHTEGSLSCHVAEAQSQQLQAAAPVCGRVNVYTPSRHVQHMCSLRGASSSASHAKGGGEGGGGKGEEVVGMHRLEGGQIFPQKSHTHWLAANPGAGGFTLETRLFLGCDLMEDPQRE